MMLMLQSENEYKAQFLKDMYNRKKKKIMAIFNREKREHDKARKERVKNGTSVEATEQEITRKIEEDKDAAKREAKGAQPKITPIGFNMR